MNPLVFALALFFQPTASFTVGCVPDARQCSFDATKSIGAVAYTWDWGNGRSETHPTPTASNTWLPGLYCVKLTVRDASGLVSSTDKLMAFPWVANTVLFQCPRYPAVHDTVTLPAPPAVHDTVTIPGRVDTVQVVRVDTIKTKPDTIQLPGRVDTLYVVAPPPTQQTGRYIVQPTPGEYWVYDGTVLKGMLVAVDIMNNKWQAYQFILGQQQMPCLGTPANQCNIYSSQDAARDALP